MDHSRQGSGTKLRKYKVEKIKGIDTSGIRTHARRLVPKTSALDRSAIVSFIVLSFQITTTTSNRYTNTRHTLYLRHVHLQRVLEENPSTICKMMDAMLTSTKTEKIAAAFILGHYETLFVGVSERYHSRCGWIIVVKGLVQS